MVASEAWVEARDGTKLFTRVFEPVEGTPVVAVLHLHHGIGEHSGRYARFAGRLAGRGFVVVAHDGRGHGHTAHSSGPSKLGTLDRRAVSLMVEDLSVLVARTRADRPGLPVLLMGHSFGTVISQLCAGSGAAGPIAGMILASPPARPPAAVAPLLRGVVRGLRAWHGETGVAKLPGKLSFGKFNARCLAASDHTGPVTGFEWLNRDAQEIETLLDDPLYFREHTVGFWSSASSALSSLGRAGTHAGLPDQLPLCVLLGSHDFCAVDDLGPRADESITREMTAARKESPKVIVYPRARHELLFELNHEEVTDDILAFSRAAVEKSVKNMQ